MMNRQKNMVNIHSSKQASKQTKTPGVNGFKYVPKFGLLIETKTEDEQRHEFERLSALGYKPRVLVV